MQARPPHTEQLADLAALLMAVSRAIRARTTADPSVLDLSTTEVTVLRYIDHHPGIGPSAVAAGTDLQRSNLSRALRDLERKGLVERSPDPADNRQFLLRTTQLAAEDLARIRAVWASVIGEAIGGALDDHRDLPATLRLLAALERGLQ